MNPANNKGAANPCRIPLIPAVKKKLDDNRAIKETITKYIYSFSFVSLNKNFAINLIEMLNNYNLKDTYIFSFTIYLILYFTNQHYSLEDMILIGFTDQLKYLKIVDAATNSINIEVSEQQGYRFLIPYIIGKISNLLKIQNNFILFSIIMILLNALIIHTFNKIILYML